MPLSDKTRNRLLVPLAISPIMRKFAIPGIIGIFFIVLGVMKKIVWMEFAGALLAAPILWVYFVIIFIFLPVVIFRKIRKEKKNG